MGTNIKKYDALLDLDSPPNLKGIDDETTNPNGALHLVLKEARHWFRAYCTAQKQLIAIEDAERILKRSFITYWVYRSLILLSLGGNVWLYFRQ